MNNYCARANTRLYYSLLIVYLTKYCTLDYFIAVKYLSCFFMVLGQQFATGVTGFSSLVLHVLDKSRFFIRQTLLSVKSPMPLYSDMDGYQLW
jgi:hypothetical protein